MPAESKWTVPGRNPGQQQHGQQQPKQLGGSDLTQQLQLGCAHQAW